MEAEWKPALKQAIRDALEKGVTFPDLLMHLYHTVVDWSLIKTRGNQSKAAELIKMTRHRLGRYAHRKGNPKGIKLIEGEPCQDRRKTSSK